MVQGLNVVTGVVTARALGADGRGELAALLLWPTLLASLGSLGLGEAVTVSLARERTDRASILTAAAVLCAMLASVLVAIGFPLIPVLLSRSDASLIDYGHLALLLVPLGLSTLAAMSVLRADLKMVRFNAVRLTFVATNALILVALAIGGALTVEHAVVASIAANALTAGLAIAFVLSTERFGRFHRRALVELVWFGVRAHSATIGNQVNERADQAFMAALLPPAQLGLYTVAVTFTALHGLVASGYTTVMVPITARTKKLQPRAMANALLLAGTLSAFLLVLVPVLVPLLFGAEFASAVVPAQILLVAAIFLTPARVAESSLIGIGRPLLATRAELVGVVVTVAALAALLVPLGATGAAIASLLSYVAIFVVALTGIRASWR